MLVGMFKGTEILFYSFENIRETLLLYKHKLITVFAYFWILVAVKGAYCTGPCGIGLGIKCKVC